MTVVRRWARLPSVLTRRPHVVEALTVNDDFTDTRTDVPALLKARRPALGGVQEVKRTLVRKVVRKVLGWRYGVRQDMTDEGTQGVAVFWDRLRCKPVGHSSDPEEIGGGWEQLTPPGHGLLARGVVWQDVKVRVGWVFRKRIRAASTHRPPGRNEEQWPHFDWALARWAAASPLPVVVLMDCNEPGGPTALVQGTRLSWHGVGIDGALTDLPVPGGATALPRRRSDHHAVSVPIRL